MHDLEEHEEVYKISKIGLKGVSSSQTAIRLRLHVHGLHAMPGIQWLQCIRLHC